MKRPTIYLAAWLVAAIMIGAGIISIFSAFRTHRHRRASMEQAQRQIMELQDLAGEAVSLDARLTAWRETGARPTPWRVMLHNMEMPERVEARETESGLPIPGWRLRRADLKIATMEASELERLINHAQGQQHPWRLTSIELTALPGEPLSLSGVLRFETPVFR